MNGPRRHTLVWLARAPLAVHPSDRERVAAWHAAGRPYVVTRRPEGGPLLGLGFCTADPANPQLRPRRVAAVSEPGLIERSSPPPTLLEIATCPAAASCAAAFAALSEAALAEGLEIRVYGSWMWQALTGEPHVHEASDLDVLVDAADSLQADRAASFLDRQQRGFPMRCDGELALPGGRDVQWREYVQNKPDLLVKTVDAPMLVRRSTLWT